MQDSILNADAAQFEELVIQSGLPAVVYYYSDDCLPCQTFTPVFERMAQTLSGVVRFVRIFRPHNRQLADQHGIKFSPSLLFFKNGQEVCKRLTGYISYTEFKEAVESILEKKCPVREKTAVRCDVVILGAGPAGLTAAIYTARSRLYTVVIDANFPGGQVATTYYVSNYPGTNGDIRGLDLVENMKKQALSFGTHIDDMQAIQHMVLSGEEKLLSTDQNDYYAKAVILATGSEPRKLPVEGERDFRGRGVHYCATCDGALYLDADVVVVGGGTSALEEAVFLTSYAKTVTILNRSEAFKAPQSSLDLALKNPQITIRYNTTVKEVKGGQFVESVLLEDAHSGEISEMKTDGVFVYIGTEPNSKPFAGMVALSERGYILADEKMTTNLPGVFAAGDVREKEIRQIATAVGDGAIAGIMAERYIRQK